MLMVHYYKLMPLLDLLRLAIKLTSAITLHQPA